MNVDLESMSLAELKTLHGNVSKAIASYEERKKRQALIELEGKAKELGFSLAELTGLQSPRKKKSPIAPKYANPANPSETWSGRGRKPRWYIKALESGMAAADLEI